MKARYWISVKSLNLILDIPNLIAIALLFFCKSIRNKRRVRIGRKLLNWEICRGRRCWRSIVDKPLKSIYYEKLLLVRYFCNVIVICTNFSTECSKFFKLLFKNRRYKY